jgi:hypothetical protein
MAAHKGPATLRPRCTRSGSSVAVIPVYQSNLVIKLKVNNRMFTGAFFSLNFINCREYRMSISGQYFHTIPFNLHVSSVCVFF